MPGKTIHREKDTIRADSGEYGSSGSVTGTSPITTLDDFRVAEPRDVGSIILPSTETVDELLGVYTVDTASTYTEKFVHSNAIWGGPLSYSTVDQPDNRSQDTSGEVSWFYPISPEDMLFDIQYDIQEVTTDALSPIVPPFSMPTRQRSGEHHPLTTRVKLVEYVE